MFHFCLCILTVWSSLYVRTVSFYFFRWELEILTRWKRYVWINLHIYYLFLLYFLCPLDLVEGFQLPTVLHMIIQHGGVFVIQFKNGGSLQAFYSMKHHFIIFIDRCMGSNSDPIYFIKSSETLNPQYVINFLGNPSNKCGLFDFKAPSKLLELQTILNKLIWFLKISWDLAVIFPWLWFGMD